MGWSLPTSVCKVLARSYFNWVRSTFQAPPSLTRTSVTLCGSGPDIANGMVFIQAITGADPKNPVGATAVAGVGKISGKVAPASVALTTTKPGSLVAAVGSDWSDPAPRTIPAGQVMLHEDESTPNGDNYWVQGLPGAVVMPGPVTLSVSAPTDDDCNMAAVEILRAPG